MKKIIHLIGILTIFLLSFVGNAQISDYALCDDNNDGMVYFDLTTKIDEILDGANPNDYMITFHETENDAQTNIYSVPDPTSYPNLEPYIQVMYVRVENLNDSTFVVDSFNLIINSILAGTPDNLYNYDGTFDLTENDSLITQGNSYTVSYFLTEINASDNVSPIADPTNFVTAVNTTIWFRAEDTNGCFFIASFKVFIDAVYIPDANFKAKLLTYSPTIDTNGDAEIQVSEALNVYELNVSQSNIGDLTGIEAFINLTKLLCTDNNLTQLDVSNSVNLITLWCNYNNLTELDVSNNVNLTNFLCTNNNLTELDVSNSVNLIMLWCNSNNLTELDVSNNVNLTTLLCSSNNLTELDVSDSINLTMLRCYFNNLTELDVSNNINLIDLRCFSNNLTELDVSNNVNLTELNCNSNNLTELDVSNNVNLTSLSCGNLNLTELDVSNNINLNSLNVNINLLTELDVSNNVNLIVARNFNQKTTEVYEEKTQSTNFIWYSFSVVYTTQLYKR